MVSGSQSPEAQARFESSQPTSDVQARSAQPPPDVQATSESGPPPNGQVNSDGEEMADLESSSDVEMVGQVNSDGRVRVSNEGTPLDINEPLSEKRKRGRPRKTGNILFELKPKDPKKVKAGRISAALRAEKLSKPKEKPYTNGSGSLPPSLNYDDDSSWTHYGLKEQEALVTYRLEAQSLFETKPVHKELWFEIMKNVCRECRVPARPWQSYRSKFNRLVKAYYKELEEKQKESEIVTFDDPIMKLLHEGLQNKPKLVTDEDQLQSPDSGNHSPFLQSPGGAWDDDNEEDDEELDGRWIRFNNDELEALITYRLEAQDLFENSHSHRELWTDIMKKICTKCGVLPRPADSYHKKFTKLVRAYYKELEEKKKVSDIISFDDPIMKLLHEGLTKIGGLTKVGVLTRTPGRPKKDFHLRTKTAEREHTTFSHHMLQSPGIDGGQGFPQVQTPATAQNEMLNSFSEMVKTIVAETSKASTERFNKVLEVFGKTKEDYQQDDNTPRADPRIVDWLASFNRQSYAKYFAAKHIDWEALEVLEKEDFIPLTKPEDNLLGLPVIIARVIWAQLEKLRASKH